MIKSAKCYQLEKSTLELVEGDITDLDVDAIICPATNNLKPIGDAGNSTKIKSGNSAQRLFELGSVEDGKGKLPSGQHVFLLVLEDDKDSIDLSDEKTKTNQLKAITSGLKDCFDKADKLNFSSIALPVFSNGKEKMDREIFLNTQLNNLAALSKKHNDKIKRVFFVVPTGSQETNSILSKMDMLVTSPTSGFFDNASPWMLAAVGVGLPFLVPAAGPAIAALVSSAYFLLKKKKKTEKQKSKVKEANDKKETPILDERSKALSETIKSKQWVKIAAGLEKHIEKLEPGANADLLRLIRTICLEIVNYQQKTAYLEESLDMVGKSAIVSTEPVSETILRPDRLPMPLAFANELVFADQEPLLARENARKGIGLLMHYLAVVALTEYWNVGGFSSGLNSRLDEILSRNVTDGSWLEIAVSVANAFAASRREAVVLEGFPTILIKDKESALGLLRGLVSLRNKIHDSGPESVKAADTWVKKARSKWRQTWRRLGPILTHRLVNVVRPDDFIGENETKYLVKWLQGQTFLPRSEYITIKERLKKDFTYLTNDEMTSFIPTNPSILYEPCSITQGSELSLMEKASFREDIVHFSTFRFSHSFSKKGLGFKLT